MSEPIKYKTDFGNKARAATRAAIECKNKKVDPSCTDCTDIPAIRAVILYPNLGTPLILPPGSKKLNIFIVAEAKSYDLFSVMSHPDQDNPATKYPSPAQLGYMYVDKHLRVYPIDGKAAKEDTKEGRLWKDGRVCGTAFQHVKVWCLGDFNSGRIRDIDGNYFANIRHRTVNHYNSIEAAHPDPKDLAAANVPLKYIYQIQIDLANLPHKPGAGQMATLAWMVALPSGYKKQKALAGLNDWEYQDKLIYDFLESQKKNPKKSHLTDLYEFDISHAVPNKLPKKKSDLSHRLKAWHPVIQGKKTELKIGHLSDVHVNSRHFALINSNACILEGISQEIGPKITNCFLALKELFEEMKEVGADVIYLTGDLLDFNRNLDPRQVTGSSPKEQWPIYDLANNVADGKLYPRGIDDMLIFSLLRYSYKKLHLPVFIITGNHEAYDIPYGISPRATLFMAKAAVTQFGSDNTVAIPARLRAAYKVGAETAADAQKIAEEAKRKSDQIGDIPVVGKVWKGAGNLTDEAAKRINIKKVNDLQKFINEQIEESKDPNKLPKFDQKMNDGIPCDHNITIYEACLIYGPTFMQTPKPFNFTPDNYDWFFTLFTPLADYRIDYNDQVLLGLDWGDSEAMVKADMTGGEVGNIYGREASQLKEDGKSVLGNLGTITSKVGSGIMDGLMGLPRADLTLNANQKVMIDEVRMTQKKVMLFTHFTLINYEYGVPLNHTMKPFPASDNELNKYTMGTFALGRDFLYPRLNHNIQYSVAGHSHRCAVYSLDNANTQAMKTVGYQPAEYKQADSFATDMHGKMFKDRNTTRILVSSCGGPIGVQTLKGELFGWNMMPPSGTLIDISAEGAQEFQRIVTKKYKPGTPRFCVALDYVQVHVKKMVIGWVLNEPKYGHYFVVVGNILEYKPFIEKITFYVWDSENKNFSTFITGIGPVSDDGNLYNMYIFDPVNFFKATKIENSNMAKLHVFAQINFNHTLSSNPIYSQYNFDDPWIFRVDIKDRQIECAKEMRAEIPDWEWLAKMDPSRYLRLKKNNG